MAGGVSLLRTFDGISKTKDGAVIFDQSDPNNPFAAFGPEITYDSGCTWIQLVQP